MREDIGALLHGRATNAVGAKRAQLYHQLPIANKARKAPQARQMCANLTPF